MTDTEPWDDDGDESAHDLLAELGAAAVFLGVLWFMILSMTHSVEIGLGAGGLLVTLGVVTIAATEAGS